MKTKLLGVALAALTVTACAGPVSTRPDPVALKNAVSDTSDKGVLVMDTSGNLGCDSTTIGLMSDTGKFVNLTDYRSTKAGPAVGVVAPGKYRIFSGRCTVPGYYPSQLPSLRIWFGTVDVKAGETIYAGTLDTNRVDVKSKLEGFGAVWGALNNFSTKKQSTYLTYEMLDKSSELRQTMQGEEADADMADVANRMVFRPPLKVLDKGEYEAAIMRAYAPTAEGKTPTKDEVDARFADEMQIALQNSLKKVASEMGLSDTDIEDMTKT